MQEIGIESSVLNEIIEGRKTIEGRLGKPKFLRLHEGERLSLREDIWKDGEITQSFPGMAKIEIIQVLYFESFAEMFESIDCKQVIPTAKNVREALEVYRRFYATEDETEYGVVAFEFTLV